MRVTVWKRTWVSNRKKGQAWVVDGREAGRRSRKSFPTRQEAELYRDKLIRERYAAEYGELLDDLTLEQFVDIYNRKKPWKSERYRERVLSSVLNSPFIDSFLSRISTANCEQWRDSRLKDVAPATVRQDLAALHDCLKWAVKLHYLRKNPCDGVDRPSLPVKQDDPAAYIAQEEFEKLTAVSGRDAPLYQFAAWTGLRISELIDLEWDDIRDGYVLVRRGKGQKQRIVPLLPPALEALGTVPRHVALSKVFWYAADRHALLRRFQRRCTWAQIKSYRFHDLRHTFGSWAAQAGVSLEVIAEAMGHTSITVTKRYAHLSPEYKRRELEKMVGAKVAQARRKSPKRKKPSNAENPGVGGSIPPLPTTLLAFPFPPARQHIRAAAPASNRRLEVKERCGPHRTSGTPQRSLQGPALKAHVSARSVEGAGNGLTRLRVKMEGVDQAEALLRVGSSLPSCSRATNAAPAPPTALRSAPRTASRRTRSAPGPSWGCAARRLGDRGRNMGTTSCPGTYPLPLPSRPPSPSGAGGRRGGRGSLLHRGSILRASQRRGGAGRIAWGASRAAPHFRWIQRPAERDPSVAFAREANGVGGPDPPTALARCAGQRDQAVQR